MRWKIGWFALGLVACGPTEEPDVDRPLPPVIEDTDGDGLSDEWERWAGDLNQLDPNRADTNGDGINDGEEDPDGDGLDNLEEFLAERLTPLPIGLPPHPFQRSLLVELDTMTGRSIPDGVLVRVSAAYDAIDIGLHFFADETNVPAVDFDGSFDQRQAVFERHGPIFEGVAIAGVPIDRMIHVVVAKARTDIAGRGGEVVTHADDDPNKTGVFIYRDVLDAIHPACGRPEGGPILLEDALAGTMVHEIGHALQLGHDTDRDGGVNYFNIMAVASTCDEALMRFEGVGNDDATRGATAAIADPRFSASAAALIDFDRQLSVHTGTLVDDTGREM